ncbi:ATP-dependent Clp protease proteolytic subunit [Chromobacterium sp. TRC.1.1.SA]|uniref:ATP-dependent Clp protease proteolytic subunit n=1 Tax=Chromobacterium indicum TaxID=3110228 RepID=A0ABV0CPH9_9NEIS
MPTREKITSEINLQKIAGQDKIRRKYLALLHKKTNRDTVIYFSAYNIQRSFLVPSAALSVNQEDIQGFMTSLHKLKGTQLDLIIHSPGGSSEAADQIVQYLRAKYNHIRAIIPQNAMSAATMLACAADEIVMGKHSAIGPIDPQIMINMPNGGQSAMPAHTILQDFYNAKIEIMQNPVLSNSWAPRFSSLPAGYLNFCQQLIQQAEEKVKTWLGQYMFQNDNEGKAERVAKWLADFSQHRTHGRPIGIDLAREKGLIVTPLEADQELQEAVLSVFHATMATFQTTGCLKVIENHLGKGLYVTVGPPSQPQSSLVNSAWPTS